MILRSLCIILAIDQISGQIGAMIGWLWGVNDTIDSIQHDNSKFIRNDSLVRSPHRILELMRSYYEEANNRIMEMNDMRFMYEETAPYEQGYVMGEIIERYRKVVEHTHAAYKYRTYQVYDLLRRVELIQKLYFEIYHLVRMMHEIPQKYDFIAPTKASKKRDARAIFLSKKYAADIQKRRAKAAKKRKKQLAEIVKKYDQSIKQLKPGQKRVPYNKWWPLDYGWEISDNWTEAELFK